MSSSSPSESIPLTRSSSSPRSSELARASTALASPSPRRIASSVSRLVVPISILTSTIPTGNCVHARHGRLDRSLRRSRRQLSVIANLPTSAELISFRCQDVVTPTNTSDYSCIRPPDISQITLRVDSISTPCGEVLVNIAGGVAPFVISMFASSSRRTIPALTRFTQARSRIRSLGQHHHLGPHSDATKYHSRWSTL